MKTLNQNLIGHWQQLRQMSIDLIDELSDKDMGKKLPFENSQTLGNQYYCMIGTQETFVNYYLEDGEWKEWKCSLNEVQSPSIGAVKRAMAKADDNLNRILEKVDLLAKVGDGTVLDRYFTLVEHESHHQGQLINFIYAHDLPIPKSWADKWALSRD